MYIDTHTHLSYFSNDGRQNIEELLVQADNIGLAGVCTADHYEKGVFYTPEREEIFDLDEYFKLLEPIRQSRKNCATKLLIGIELGWMPGRETHYAELIGRYDFDSVVLSLHILDGEDPYCDQNIYREGKIELYKRYLRRLRDLVSLGLDFDILAHFDYITRYAPYPDRKMRYTQMPDEFDSFFAVLAGLDKSLEINAATINKLQQCGYKDNDAWPDPDIIRAYIKAGGKKISIGSDAHRAADLGRYLPETDRWLKNLGLSDLTAYQQRKPISGRAI